MYALNLSDDKRILSVCIALLTTPDTLPRVDLLPDGEVTDYRYENGEYIYDPLPDPPNPPPSEIDALKEHVATIEDALCEMDEANEERIALIEDALCELDKE